MSDQLPDRPDEGHPIIAGLVALVGVGLVVGLILGLGVLVGSKVLGLGGGDGAGTASDVHSMYLPKPQKTPTPTAPEITLDPGETPTGSDDSSPTDEPTESKSPDKQISLSSSVTSVGPMEQFTLTGVYPGGEGAILQVQRFQAGQWTDFQATGSVSDETFAIPVQTGQVGMNRFRVVDTDSGLESDEVRITIG
ncbi:hypothetical protein ABLE68_10290 [Nocardioides sp. CN2-186]|uniref:hypothetical protein n=1 Tax=Nocardioides tweenelious TaxID=3156607 RepID=UPI0032B370AE